MEKNLETKVNLVGHFKRCLEATDYQAIKFIEGELTEEEYAPMRERRKAWRAEINKLEAEIEAMKQ